MKKFHILVCAGLVFITSCVPILSTTPEVTPTDILPTQIPPTASSTLAPTFTPATYPVTFTAFYDYNGNGILDEGESLLEGIVNKTEAGECKTGEDGICEIILPAGDYHFSVETPDTFKFFTPSIDSDIKILSGMDILIEEATVVLEPLTEGPYRSPFRSTESVIVKQWKDLDIRSCFGTFPDRNCEFRQDWLGGRNTYDGHDGTDFQYSGEMYAMRSGVVYEVELMDPAKPLDGYGILIRDNNPLTYFGDSYHGFAHVLNINVSVGDEVDPNTLIGSGSSIYNGGKIHLSFDYAVPSGTHPYNVDFRINPYHRDPFGEHLWTSIFALPKIYEDSSGFIRLITNEIYLDNWKVNFDNSN